ncbi:MAG: hypothetical protein ACJ8FU_18770 [Xanthobacteraceae bacterium]|jgi:hypothetical protein
MYHVAGITGGFLATVGILSLAISGPTSWQIVSSTLTSPLTRTADQLDRAHKGDRLASPKRSGAQDRSVVTTVEVIGVRDTAIVYRNRDGTILFRTDPVANVTIVAKDATLPEVTVREHSEAVPQKVPVKTLREGDKDKRLEGCDPLVSPLAGPLSQVPSRCIAGIAGGEKVALLTR